MGNVMALEPEDDEDLFEGEDMLNYDRIIVGDNIGDALGNVMGHIIGQIQGHRTSFEMPVIRKKPDLTKFRENPLYSEIKALSGLPANSKCPLIPERCNLARGLMKREMGLASHLTGSFTPNQHRRIANYFVPNQKINRMMSLESKVFVCKFNKDGSKLITACQNSIIRVFDTSKGTYHRINRVKATSNWSILDVDFSPCGKYYAHATWLGYFFIAPLDGGPHDFLQLDLNPNIRTGIFSIRFSPGGEKVIGGCSNSYVYIIDRESRRVDQIRMQHNTTNGINAVSFVCETDQNTFVSGCNNGVIKLWDMRIVDNSRHVPSSIFVGHLDGITYIDPRNDGRYILSNSKDQSIKLWDLRISTNVRRCNKVNLPLLDWDYRWDTVPREYYNPRTSLDGDASIMTYRGHRVVKTLLRAKFSPTEQTGSRYIYTGCGTGRIIIYDVLTGTIKEAIEGHRDVVRDLSWHPVRSEIISSSWDSHVNLNAFKRNHIPRHRSTSASFGPIRRSRRIAHQNGTIDDMDEAEDRYNYW